MKCVLFRPEDEDELKICSKYLPTFEYRSTIPKNSLIIGRYSVLPFYQELEKELLLNGSKLINTYEQHRYIADIKNYYEDIKEYTAKTFSTWYSLPEGQYVVKGATNSRKHQWKTHMFAKDLNSLRNVINLLLCDSLIGQQGLVVREYIPLMQLGEGMNGLPITREFRLFYFREEFLAGGFYWSEFPEFEEEVPEDAIKLGNVIAKIVSKNTNFFVLDVAQTRIGDWILIEVNDGQMSGLSCTDADTLYKKLAEI